MISGAAEHDAVELRIQKLDALCDGRNATVQHERQRGKILAQFRDHVVSQRWNFAIGFWAQALEYGVSGMHHEDVAPRVRDGADEVAHEVVGINVIEPDAMFYRDWDMRRHHVKHRFDAIRNQRRFRHQARTERTALHTLRRTAAVQIDLVVAPVHADLRGTRKVVAFATAELQRDGMFDLRETQVTPMLLLAAEYQRAGGDHFGVQPRVRCEQAEQHATVTIRPIHHRGGGESPRAWRAEGRSIDHGAIFAGCFGGRTVTSDGAKFAPERSNSYGL